MADKICFLIVIIVSYLIGSMNASVVISKLLGDDIRNHGSGNAGATNMLRTYGKKMAALALIIDMLKGVIAASLALLVKFLLNKNGIDTNLTDGFKYVAALCAVLGHNYPVFFSFKGGKGIATSGAVMFVLDWRAGLVVLIGALLVMAITKIVSLGSLVGAVLYVLAPLFFMYFVDKDINLWFVFVTVIMAALAIIRHRANIVRIIKGTESKIGDKAK